MTTCNTVLQGHVLEVLKDIPDEYFDCVITSPPYWGLRDYGLEPIVWDAQDGCEHQFIALESCSQLLSIKTEGISFIKQTSKNGTIGSIEINNPTFCSLIEVRREPESDKNIFQSDGKKLTSSRKTNSSGFINCPVAVEYSEKMINEILSRNIEKRDSLALAGKNTEIIKNGQQFSRPDTPSVNDVIVSCPLLSNGLCRCNMVSDKLSEFLVLGNEGYSTFVHDISICYHETQQIGEFACPLNKKGKIYFPFSLISGIGKEFTHASLATERFFVPHFPVPSRTFHFFSAAVTNNDSSGITALWRAVPSLIEMGGLNLEGFPATFANLEHECNICIKCGAVKCSLGLEPFFDDKVYLMPNGNIFEINGYLSHLMQIMAECRRVLKKTGTMWVNIGDSYAGSGRGIGTDRTKCKESYTDDDIARTDWSKSSIPAKSLIGIPERFAIRMTDELGMIRRNTVIWWKRNCMPSSANDRHTVDFEPVYFFTKNKKYWFKQQKEPTLTYDYSIRDRDNTKLNNIPGRTRMGGLKTNQYTERNRRCVWDIPTKPFSGAHFAVFPDTLVTPMLSAGCPLDGWVLDPFAGSGTVGMVAKQQGKNSIGIELNPEYCAMAEARI